MELEIRLICGTTLQLQGDAASAAYDQIMAVMSGSAATEEDYRALLYKGDGEAVLRAVEDIMGPDQTPTAILLGDKEGWTHTIPLSSISFIKSRDWS